MNLHEKHIQLATQVELNYNEMLIPDEEIDLSVEELEEIVAPGYLE